MIDYSPEFKENYRQCIALAAPIFTERLNQAFTILSGGRSDDLDFIKDTTTKTKMIQPWWCYAMEDAAISMGWSYTDVDAVGYDTEAADPVDDVIINVEDKLSFGKDVSVFATGNNHSKVKDNLHFVVKFEHQGNVMTGVFAALVDVPNLKNPRSGWDDNVTKSGNNNNGFSSLKIHSDDWQYVDVIYGDVKQNSVWMRTFYEDL